jgi:hypothetical protein
MQSKQKFYARNGTQLFEGVLYTIEGQKGVFKFTNRGEFGLIRVNGALFSPFTQVVERGYNVKPY